MSLYKSVAYFEKIWEKSFGNKSPTEIADFCIMCKENLQITEKFLFKTKFQQNFIPYFCSVLCDNPQKFQILDPLLWVVDYLAEKKKFKLKKLHLRLFESFLTFLKHILSTDGEIINETLEIVAKVLKNCENFVDFLNSNEDSADQLEKKLMDVVVEVSKSKNYRNLVWVSRENNEKNEFLNSFLKIVAKIVIKTHKKCAEDIIFSIFSATLMIIEKDLKEWTDKRLICERFLVILRITIELSDKHRNFCSIFLTNFGEKIKSVFGECISAFDQDLHEINSFLTDKNRLAELFNSFLTVLLNTTKGPEQDFTIWNIPMIIFHMIFSSVTTK